MNVTFWGTRGSIPVPGENTLKYGGNTPCIQITLNSGQEIILDAGSGIRGLGNSIIKNSKEKIISIIISHTHWDHIQGLPFFMPLFQEGYTIDIYLFKQKGKDISQIIKGQMNNYFFPVTSEILPAKINYQEINEDQPLEFGEARVIPKTVHHSPGTFAYKVVVQNKSLVYMTDNEIEYSLKNDDIDIKNLLKNNKDLIDFCEAADYLIHDTMYHLDDYKKNWGHSNDFSVAIFSHLAKVKNLLLFHFNPEYDDKSVDNLVTETKKRLKELQSDVICTASREGMTISI